MVTNFWQSQFTYDGLGRRRIRQDYVWLGNQWTLTNTVHYVYDGMTVIQERDGSNNPLVTYTRGTDLSGTAQGAGGIGGLLARTDGSGSSYYHTDGNGNVTMLVNGSGAMAAKYLYDSYGNTLGTWGTLAAANTYRYSSKEIDLKSGLYYYGYRYYQPNLQRWLNRDPIAEAGGINLYDYVQNDPVNLIDPLGFSPADVSRLTTLSQQYTQAMTQNGQRMNNGALNNLTSSFQSLLGNPSPHLGCGQQALALANFLNGTGTDDQWQFSYMEIYDPAFHQLVIAQSSNPADPILYLDSWNNSFGATPPALYYLGPITPAINSTGNSNSTLPPVANPAHGPALVP